MANIRTYSNAFISKFQSAVNHVLADDENDGTSLDNLGAEHPVMKATCEACDAVMGGEHVHETAEKVERGDLVKACANLFDNGDGGFCVGSADLTAEFGVYRLFVSIQLTGKHLKRDGQEFLHLIITRQLK